MSRRGIKWGIAKPEWRDGIRFASRKEARRYDELKLRVKAGDVIDLEVQPSYPIDAVNPWNGEVVACGVYRADFRYREYRRMGAETGWYTVVEDVKGMRTPVYRLKKRLVEGQYGIRIVEV